VKHSVTIAGHRTSVWIEEAFWSALVEIATGQDKSIATVIADIDRSRSTDSNLSSAIRLFVLDHYRNPDRR
jgi:predicted DNA-binding ribbon-helix-helix protein